MKRIEKGIYRHNKNNQLYEVMGIAHQTEGGDPLVIYKPLYESEYEMFARPYKMFVELVELDAKHVPKFEKIPDDDLL